MLYCPTCIRSCIRTAFSDISHIDPLSTLSSPHSPITRTRRIGRPATCRGRGYTAQASLPRHVPDPAPALGLQNLQGHPHERKLQGSFYRTHEVGKLSLNKLLREKGQQTQDRGKALSDDDETYKKSHLRFELRWLKDPVKLADHTVKLLRDDDFLKALDLVRLASKDVECTVSWNHLIDHEMSKARVTEAVKLYNEMKKRAQLPDSYTFTILFRGLARYPRLSKTTTRALSIYQSMFAENSPVRPSIIHTNAVVNVCARAHDIDALLGIAANLPVHGSGAPNKLTYTIILNAIQSNAAGEYDPQTASSRRYDSARMERATLAVQQGRRLWLEIKQRWMRGDLALDEDLVCAMGRLLLLGRETQDLDDILSLLEQTMGIPRQIARLTDSAPRRAEEDSGPEDDSELPPPDSLGNIELETLLSSPKQEDKFLRSPSDPFAPCSSGPHWAQSAVRPGRNTLSLVLEACIALKYVRGAQNYWGLLTSPNSHYNIVPDGENYHMYLRLLRVQRASKLAVEFVDEMRSGKLTGNARDVQAKTFRIALSCCVRDANNRDSIVHAGKLARMMMDTLPHPDAKALILYLKVALSQKPRDWRVIMGVIRGTELGVRNLRSLMAYDPAGRQKQNHKDVLELVKGMIGAYDVVLDLGNEEIKKEEKKRCKEQRFTLAAYITRTNTHYVQLEEWRKRRKLEDQEAGREPTEFQRRKMLEKRLPPSGG